MTYLFALAVATAGAAYAAVPLYRVFCQQTGYGGTTQVCVCVCVVLWSADSNPHDL